MKKNGFIASSLLYGMLALFLTLMLSTIYIMSNNKLSMDKLKKKALGEVQKNAVYFGNREVEIVTSGDGLYRDQSESGRSIYRGANPNNYITFDNLEAGFRIISVESDSTIKIIKITSLGNMVFDTADSRATENNFYCTEPASGCNFWAERENAVIQYFPNGNDDDSSKVEGSVTVDASLNTYLNNDYLGTISENDRDNYMERGKFYIGSPGSASDEESISTDVSQEKRYNWEGYVGLITATEFARTSTDVGCTSLNNFNSCFNANWMNFDSDWWTISPLALENQTTDVIIISQSNRGANAKDSYGVHPVVYLKSDVKLEGEGTLANPYKIVQSS